MLNADDIISNCIDNAKPSSYDIPGLEQKVKVGVLLSMSRLDKDIVLLVRLEKDVAISVGDKLFHSDKQVIVRDIITVNTIARIVA